MSNSPGGKVNAANLNIEGLNPESAVVGTDVVILGRTGQANKSATVSQLGGGGVPDPLLLSDGTVLAPTYSFVSDPNSGFFRASTFRLGITVDGVLIAVFKNAGVNQKQFIISEGLIQNQASAPSFAFGDGNTGFFESADNVLNIATAGVARFQWNADAYQSFLTTGPALLNEAASLTNPTLIPDRGQLSTGVIGRGSGFNQVGFGVVGIPAIVYEAFSSGVLQTNFNSVGVVASVTQTQGGATQLISSWNEVATVANVGDALRAPPVDEGERLCVINNGANQAQLFPIAGDDFGAGVNASINIDAGNVAVFLGRDGTNWDTLFNASPSGGVPDPLLLNDGSAAAPTYSFSADPDTGFFRVSADRIGIAIAGTARYTADATFFSGSGGFSGAIRAIIGSATIPSLTFLNDSDTGIGRAAADQLSLIAGAIEAERLSEASSQILKNVSEQIGLTASVTQTQAGGLQLLSSYNEIATVANVDDTVVAPSVSVGLKLTIINNGANQLQVFPFLGDDIGAGVDAAIFIASGAIGKFIGQTATLWDTLYNALPSPSGGAGTANDAVQARRTTTLDLTTAFVDVTLDATDVETDAAVIEHDAITDRIEVKVNGTYEISYQFDNDSATVATSSAEVDARIRLNDAGTDMNGSLSLSSIHRTGGGQAAVMPQSVCISFIADLSANDFVTLQVQKRDIVLTETWFINNVSVKVKRLL